MNTMTNFFLPIKPINQQQNLSRSRYLGNGIPRLVA